ncbi:GNAT family N-acetyltransferase [Macrococcus bovicus]|nr:GNAT family protein [Macrococcus bovicus]
MKLILNADLYLRNLNRTDEKAFYNLLVENYAYFKEALTWLNQNQLKKQAFESLELRIKMVSREKSLPLWFGIIYKEQLCGMIGFNELDSDNDIGEMGYFIGEKFASKGIMTSSLESMIDYSFNRLMLNKIELYIAENNQGSCRVSEKLDFKLEGIIRESQKIEGQYINQKVYGLLYSEYVNTNKNINRAKDQDIQLLKNS